MVQDEFEILDPLLVPAGDLVRSRREGWQTCVNDVLLPTLEACIAKMPKTAAARRLYVREFSQFKNFNVLQLWLGNIPSGISLKTDRVSASGVERGAALLFSQMESGEVRAIAYPFGTDLPDRPQGPRERFWVGPRYSDPSEISSDTVRLLFLDFVRLVAPSSILTPEADVPGCEFEWKPADDLRRSDDVQHHALVEQVLGSIKGLGETISDVSEQVAAMSKVAEQVGELHEEFEAREVTRLLSEAEPRTRNLARRIIELTSKGLIREEDLK